MRVLRTEGLFIYFIYLFISICLYTVKNHQVGKCTARSHGKYFGALERNSPILFFPMRLFKNQILSLSSPATDSWEE